MLQRSLGVDPATSADIYGSNTWLREVSNTSRIGPDTWPPPNSAIFGYDGLSSPVPYLTLPNAINYTTLTPPKPWISGRFSGRTDSGPYPANLAISTGQQTPTLTRNSAGVYTISWGSAHPQGVNYAVFSSTTQRLSTICYSDITATSFKLTLIENRGGSWDEVDPFEISFMTSP
jgi:hypothetical protein